MNRRHQGGFSVVLVLAIIVLMGGVLAYAATLTSAMHSSQAQEIAAVRALQAARAGLEWGRYRIRIGALPNCAAATNLVMPLSSGNMPVTVRCIVTGAFTEAGIPVTTYQLSATACLPAAAGACPNAAGAGDYVERQVTGIAER
jgi:MSHA biogenesis protein MshP